MPDTVVGLFPSPWEGEEGLRKRKDAGFGDGQASVSTRGTRPA